MGSCLCPCQNPRGNLVDGSSEMGLFRDDKVLRVENPRWDECPKADSRSPSPLPPHEDSAGRQRYLGSQQESAGAWTVDHRPPECETSLSTVYKAPVSGTLSRHPEWSRTVSNSGQTETCDGPLQWYILQSQRYASGCQWENILEDPQSPTVCACVEIRYGDAECPTFTPKAKPKFCYKVTSLLPATMQASGVIARGELDR